MGTRGLYGLVVDGEVKASYNHWDSYPSFLGHVIVDVINQEYITVDNARNLVMVDEETEPSAEEIDRAVKAGLYNSGVSTGEVTEWYALLREAQGYLHKNLEIGLMIDNANFAGDSLFCEWGYLVNLDTQVLEVYQGFNTDKAVGRFADYPTVNEEYGPITLVAEIPFVLENGTANFENHAKFMEAKQQLVDIENQ